MPPSRLQNRPSQPKSSTNASSSSKQAKKKCKKTKTKKGKMPDTVIHILALRTPAKPGSGEAASTTYEALLPARFREISKAAALARRRAKAAQKKAAAEPKNKARCMAALKQRQQGNAPTDRQTMVVPLKKKATTSSQNAAAAVNDHVDVCEDLSSGMWRFGGRGRVVAVHGTGGATVIDVVSLNGADMGKMWYGVPIMDFTVLPPVEDYRLERRRAKPQGFSFANPLLSVPPAPRMQGSLKEELKYGWRYGRAMGWRRCDLHGNDATGRLTEDEKHTFMADYRELMAMTAEMMKQSAGVRDKAMVKKRDQGGTFAALDRAGPLTNLYLTTVAWGIGKNSGKTIAAKARPIDQSIAFLDSSLLSLLLPSSPLPLPMGVV